MRPDASTKLQSVAPKQGPSKGLIAGIVGLVAVLAIAAVAFFSLNKSDDADSPVASGETPTGALANGQGMPVYADKAKSGAKKVDVYFDYQCPFCKQFEQAQGAKLLDMAKSGDVKLAYHVKTFLDENISGGNSARAANAAFCTTTAGKFPEFTTKVFENQPKEGVGYTNDTLIKLAKEVGVKGSAFESCVKDDKYAAYVKKTESETNKAGVNSTPVIKINGKDVDNADMAGMMNIENSTPTTIDKVLAKF